MNRDVVIAEWRRSTETLAAADLLVREDYAGAGISTAYYAVLHAAKAALFANGVTAESHSAVRRLFAKHMVRTGEIEAEFSKHLARSADDRLTADYDVGVFFTAEDGSHSRLRARTFVERIRLYLLTKGLTEDDLAS